MQLILDHLSAIIAAAGVVLLLSLTQISTSHAGVEEVATHSVKAKTLVFGHWIERDILDLGKNMGRNRFRFLPPTNDANGNTTNFTFFSDSTCTAGCSFAGGLNVAAGDTARVMTRYLLAETMTATLRDTTGTPVERQLYEVKREVSHARLNNGTPQNQTSWVQDRWTIGTLSQFEIAMLRRDGSVTTNPEDGDFIRVQFSVVPEWILDPENYIREIYWTTTLKVRPYWEPPPSW